ELAKQDPAVLANEKLNGRLLKLNCPGGVETLVPADIVIDPKGPEGWAAEYDTGTQLIVDTRITPELASEGMARAVVRHVQNSRKDAGLEMEDRIALYLATESMPLRQAIETHRSYISNETLTAQWSTQPLTGEGDYRASGKVDGQALSIELRKVR